MLNFEIPKYNFFLKSLLLGILLAICAKIIIEKMSSGQVIPIITKISSRIIRILGCNPSPMTLQGTNTYLLGTGDKRILLDTGDTDHPKYIEHLRAVLKEENARIETILLTHWHHDHIGGVKDILKHIDSDCKIWKYPRIDKPDIYDELPETISVHQLTDGQIFEVEGVKVRVRYTPGHTTDHIILTLDDDQSLFSGDCILGEGTAVFEDLYEYMKSLNLILNLNPSVIYPGHGNIINDPVPKIKYYIEHRNQREQQILNVLKANPDKQFTELDLVKIIYKETPEALWPAAAYNVNHHLKKLVKENLVNEVVVDSVSYWRLKSNSML